MFGIYSIPVRAQFPSGNTRVFKSIRALGRVLSGNGKPSGGLQASISRKSLAYGQVRGVSVQDA